MELENANPNGFSVVINNLHPMIYYIQQIL